MSNPELGETTAWGTSILQLSREERALYNPAFTALLAGRAVQGHLDRYNQPCPLAVAVLASVMALQPAVRRVLPETVRSGLIRWLEENKSVKVAMLQNATALSAVVRPGVVLALHNRVLGIDESGHLFVEPRRLPKKISGLTPEIDAIETAAYFLGRWLPSAGSLSTVMALLGVRP